ncbi:hypothetical protein BH09MYX1_BH09MYX1_13920 [soil metagenome]
MLSFATKISIHAAPETIWRLLVDVGRWTEWNTTVKKVDGVVALGSKVTVHPKISDRAFPVKVLTLDEPRRMVWGSGVPFGLFKGERVYELVPQAGGIVEFSMVETFSGLFSGMITKSIPNMQPAFDELAKCLKERAERG